MKVLIYYHGMALPNNDFLRKAASSIGGVNATLLLAPKHLTEAHAIFTVGPPTGQNSPDPQPAFVETYSYCDSWMRFTEWLRVLRDFQPDVVLVLDEPLSVNVLLAGLAVKITGVEARVLFYAFNNIVQAIGWQTFRADPTWAALSAVMRKIVRLLLLDRGAMPLRRRLIYGGLVSYPECADAVRALGWNPPMLQRWWPINLQVFNCHGPRAAVDLGNRHVIGFAGRFEQEKGLNDLVDAVSELGDAYGLLLVGDGSERAALERRVVARDMASRTRFVPPQNQENLAAYYRVMEVFVLPSRTVESWKEQFGRALIEAMACGVPSVGSDSGAIPFVIGDPERVFPEGDVPALVTILRRVCGEGKPIGNARRFDDWRPDGFFSAFLPLAQKTGIRA